MLGIIRLATATRTPRQRRQLTRRGALRVRLLSCLHVMRVRAIALVLFAGAAFVPQVSEPIDAAAIAKIRDEGLNRSQVMETIFWLTDRYGPRLTGSKEFEEAGDWAVKQLQD